MEIDKSLIGSPMKFEYKNFTLEIYSVMECGETLWIAECNKLNYFRLETMNSYDYVTDKFEKEVKIYLANKKKAIEF